MQTGPQRDHVKKLLMKGMIVILTQASALESQSFAEIIETADAREGMSAFIEKRQALFTHS